MHVRLEYTAAELFVTSGHFKSSMDYRLTKRFLDKACRLLCGAFRAFSSAMRLRYALSNAGGINGHLPKDCSSVGVIDPRGHFSAN